MIDIPIEILEELKTIKNVEGILFTGSRAIGKAGKNSDWDFHILLADGAPRWRRTKKVGDTWIELFCNDRKQIETYFEEDLKEGTRAVTVFMFATGFVVHDNARNDLIKLVRHAKRIWEKGPKKLTKEDVGFINYDISGYLQDIEDGLVSHDPSPLICNYAVNEFVSYAFRLRGVWTPRPKDRLMELKKLDPEFYQTVERYLNEPDWERKARIATELGLSLGKRFHLPLNGELFLAPGR